MTGVVVAGIAVASLGYLLLKHSDKATREAEIESQKMFRQLQEEAKYARTAEEEVIFSN
jgi:type II secretory pathway pseudopilin PulG